MTYALFIIYILKVVDFTRTIGSWEVLWGVQNEAAQNDPFYESSTVAQSKNKSGPEFQAASSREKSVA